MADIKDWNEEMIEQLCDERSKFKVGTEEQIKHDKNLVGMFDAYNDRLKIESDEKTAQMEIEQKDREAKKKTAVEWVKTGLYGIGIGAGIFLGMLNRKDEREGFIVDDNIRFFDKFKRDKP